MDRALLESGGVHGQFYKVRRPQPLRQPSQFEPRPPRPLVLEPIRSF
jgi:hypothetical protein